MTCAWCGRAVEAADGYRLREEPGGRRAAFCRLEHVVPWTIRGPRWEAGAATDLEEVGAACDPDGVGRCAHCDAALAEVHLVLVRHRGEHRIADRFCSLDHLAAWAKAGGRWRAA